VPSTLSVALADEIAAGAAVVGAKPRRMASGGGHDASAFAQAGWDSVMVFVRNWNGSHNPDEAMDAADLVAAVGALYATWRE
jgi:N-carbamoyl-L-amino-acid hydrolase